MITVSVTIDAFMLGYTLGQFGDEREAREFARFVQRQHHRLRKEFDTDRRESQRGSDRARKAGA